jgi:3-methyladenine DNA glycosylase AlkD
MGIDVAGAAGELTLRLTRAGTATRAQQAKRYLKSDLAFLGATVPAVRAEAKRFVKAHLALDRAGLHALVERLWQTDVHELRGVAIAILELRGDLLRRADARWLGDLIDRADTWAHVDWMATKVVGDLLVREPSLARQLDRWAKHTNFWLRRTALLALHDPLLAGGGDFDHFAQLAQPMLSEREFFIRKAIGWVLRSAAKRRPERTYAFTLAHGAQMAGLTFREATRALNVRQRKELLQRREGALTKAARRR